MRFMMIVKANQRSEAGDMPDDKMIAAMTKYNEDLAKAGVLLDLLGLQRSAMGARIKFARDGKRTVVDGPFGKPEDLIAGYWLIQVKSRDEAIEWAKRAPAPHGEGNAAEIELRRVFELEDFADVAGSETMEQARKLEQKLAKKA